MVIYRVQGLPDATSPAGRKEEEVKPYEYRKALEVLIEHSMLARERGAYKTALDMFMMVDYPVEREDITRWGSGGIVINEEVVKAVEKMSRETKENVTLTVGELDSAEAIAMQEAEGSAEDQDEEPEGQPEEDPDNCRIPDPAAGESKADPVIGKTLEQAAGEGKADPVIDNAPEQAAGEKKRVYNFKKKKCIKCGEMFTPSYGPQKMCRDCATKIADGKITPTTSDKDSKKEAMIIVDKL